MTRNKRIALPTACADAHIHTMYPYSNATVAFKQNYAHTQTTSMDIYAQRTSDRGAGCVPGHADSMLLWMIFNSSEAHSPRIGIPWGLSSDLDVTNTWTIVKLVSDTGRFVVYTFLAIIVFSFVDSRWPFFGQNSYILHDYPLVVFFPFLTIVGQFVAKTLNYMIVH